MQGSVHHAPKRWAEEQFTGAKLTDIRRIARVKTIAEAMASGLPVIVTGYGAALDFCDDRTAFLIAVKPA